MNTQKISEGLKEVLIIVAEALERGGFVSTRRDSSLSKELQDFLNGTPNKAPELKKASEFKPEEFYLVLAKVDDVDEFNRCVHLSSCKASHWFHFDNVYEAPSGRCKPASTRKTIIKTTQE